MANKIDLTSITTAFYKLDDDLATTVVLDGTSQNVAAVSGGNSDDLHSDLSFTGNGAFDYSDGSPFVVAPQAIIPSGEFSIVLWAKDNPTFVHQDGRIFAVKDNILQLLLLRSSLAVEDIAIRINGKTIPNVNNIIRDVWHQYILTNDSDGTAKIYVDNILGGSVLSTGFAGLTDDLHIGATDSGSSRNFEGLIDGVMVFSRELLSSERAALYAQGRGVNSLIMNPADFFPSDRTANYDPSKVWDEETKLWYEPNTSTGAVNLKKGSGRFGNKLVAVSDEGSVYYEDFE